ncbi:MAG: carbon-phosphorus lyase complex subunit PhnI [Actinomycetota bacterium]
MGYVAAKGGYEAIGAAEDLVRRRRLEGRSSWLEIDQIIDRLRYSVDRVMGEGGLWDEELAARAFRQAEGDVIEAAHLIRAHRATLPRFGYTETADADDIDVLRRIVPAFREPPGPQLLGRTLDYTGRLIDRTPEDEGRRLAAEAALARHEADEQARSESTATAPAETGTGTGDTPEQGADEPEAPRVPGRLMDVLREMDSLVDRRRTDDPEPFDISRMAARPGAPRSARLSAMARAETGALVQLWYRNILGPDRNLHEVTLGEVRHGRLPVSMVNPVIGEPVTLGTLRVTEVEAIEDLDGADEDRTRFDVGYGMCLGHNERKAIAMANLDIAVHRNAGTGPLEQSVLMTTDGLDASGFLEHLKLPHYVTFRSMMERKSAMRAADHVRAERLAQGRSDCEVTDLAGTGIEAGR